jgi:hypothetical protein
VHLVARGVAAAIGLRFWGDRLVVDFYSFHYGCTEVRHSIGRVPDG